MLENGTKGSRLAGLAQCLALGGRSGGICELDFWADFQAHGGGGGSFQWIGDHSLGLPIHSNFPHGRKPHRRVTGVNCEVPGARPQPPLHPQGSSYPARGLGTVVPPSLWRWAGGGSGKGDLVRNAAALLSVKFLLHPDQLTQNPHFTSRPGDCASGPDPAQHPSHRGMCQSSSSSSLGCLRKIPFSYRRFGGGGYAAALISSVSVTRQKRD